jgi:2-C-methyl-D-erythritol 4-phosphate cytidylyltransferase
VLTCNGGAERADSVLAGLQALPDDVADAFVLVHDAARPNLAGIDLDRLLAVGAVDPVGAILAAPVRDTLKRVPPTRHRRDRAAPASVARLTPQLFRRAALREALRQAASAGVAVTDEAMAMERLAAPRWSKAGRQFQGHHAGRSGTVRVRALAARRPHLPARRMLGPAAIHDET